jgi:glycosyltransferase involved in cell wall biosynthesis
MNDRTRVLLVRDVPEQGLRSMERLADEVERGFAAHARYALTPMRMRLSRATARIPLLRRVESYATRFLAYPVAARAHAARLYHIIDHGYAHAAALLPPGRTVISCHDLTLLIAAQGGAGFRPGRISLARFRWSVSFLRRAAAVIVPTEATRRDVVRLVGVDPARIHVVPYGVDARFRPLGEQQRIALKQQITAAPHLLLHLSTGDPYKNVPATLRALAALRASGIDAVLARAGRPLTDDQRLLAASLRIEPFIVDYGTVTDARLVELYNAADALIFPSFYEGFGWPPLEAMACGTPVVTSDAAALVEVTGDAALHAAATDIDGLASALRSMLTSSDVAQRLRWAGIAQANGFSWQRTIDGFAAAYDGVLGVAAATEEAQCAA